MRLMPFCTAAAFVVCAACSGSPGSSPPPAPAVASPALSLASKSLPLVYVANPRVSNVTVYAYRDAQHAPLVQTLSGLSSPTGECVDAAQNVFVVDNGTNTIVKFAHGGSAPIGTLSNSYGLGWSCAVSPVNGDLAVVNALDGSQFVGNVAVYPMAKGSPRVYSDPQLNELDYAAYDGAGNLYVDGWNYRNTHGTVLELAKGGNALKPVKLRGAKITSPGGLQWVDGYLLLANTDYQSQATTVLYRLKEGSGELTVVRKLPLNDSGGGGEIWELGSHIIATGSDIGIFSYRNGDLDGLITNGVFEPTAAVASMP